MGLCLVCLFAFSVVIFLLIIKLQKCHYAFPLVFVYKIYKGNNKNNKIMYASLMNEEKESSG
jgi:hypothetical protein